MNRGKIIKKNLSLGLLFKILNMGIVYFTIPFLLQYLGNENYGVWVTVFSIINILFFVDAGIVNGLKTKLSLALSLGKQKIAQEYISTAYISIFSISILFFLVGFFVIQNVNLTNLLNTENGITEDNLKQVFLITLIFVVFNFFLSIYKSLYYAVNKSAKVELSLLLYQLIIFCLVYYSLQNLQSSLQNVAIYYGMSNLIISVLFSYFFFRKRQHLVPSFTFFNKNIIKELMSLSIDFFIIQLSMIVIFTTDNILISNLLGPKEVTNYDVVLKLFQVLITISFIILDPFWALFSDAFQKKDFIWIKATIKRLNKLFIILLFSVVVLVYISPKIIALWIGENIQVNQALVYSMGVFVIVRVYGAIYMYFLNGIGEIKLQKWLYIFGAIINIPISIILVKYYHLGTSGIIIGTIISILANTIILPIQTNKILKKIEYS